MRRCSSPYEGCSKFAFMIDSSLEMIIQTRFAKPCKRRGDSQKTIPKPLDCQTLQNDRGFTKLPTIIAANNTFRLVFLIG